MEYTMTIDLEDLATFENTAMLKRKITWLEKRIARGTKIEDIPVRLAEYKHRLNAIETDTPENTITEEVYNSDSKKHETIELDLGEGHYYECDSNYSIHHVVDTNRGLLVRFLGDSRSRFFPGVKLNNREKTEALDYANYLIT